MKASPNIIFLVNKLFQKQFGRYVQNWAINGYNLYDLEIKCRSGYACASFYEAYQSNIRASQAHNRGERVLHLKDEGQFGIHLNDPDCVKLFSLLEEQGREINKLLMCTT